MTDLILRPTIISGDKLANDYKVVFENRPVGRIRQATERIGHNPGWDWHITVPLPIPPWGHGAVADLEAAKSAFREAWETFYAALTPEDIAHWHHHEGAARKLNGLKEKR